MNLIQMKTESIILARRIAKNIKLSGILDKSGTVDIFSDDVVNLSKDVHKSLKDYDHGVAQKALHCLYNDFRLELEVVPEKFNTLNAILECVWKQYHPGPGMFPNFKYPGEEHIAKKDRMVIDLFCRDGRMDSISILTNPVFIRPFATYLQEGLQPRTIGYVGSVRAISIANTLCLRESELRASMMEQFIGERNSARFHNQITSAVLKQHSAVLKSSVKNDLIMDFIIKIPKVLEAEIKALDNFFVRIDALDAMSGRWTDELYLHSIVDSLKSLRGRIANLRDRYSEFHRELIYYPGGYSEVLSLAVAAAGQNMLSSTVLVDIVLLLRMSVIADTEEEATPHYLEDVKEVTACVVSFLREFREARVPSILSQPFPAGIL